METIVNKTSGGDSFKGIIRSESKAVFTLIVLKGGVTYEEATSMANSLGGRLPRLVEAVRYVAANASSLEASDPYVYDKRVSFFISDNVVDETRRSEINWNGKSFEEIFVRLKSSWVDKGADGPHYWGQVDRKDRAILTSSASPIYVKLFDTKIYDERLSIGGTDNSWQKATAVVIIRE